MKRMALVLLCLSLLLCAGRAEQLYEETPELLRVRQSTVSEEPYKRVTLKRTYPRTSCARVDAEIAALVDAVADRAMQAANVESAQQPMTIDAGALISRTGTKWMSFLTLCESMSGSEHLGAQAEARVYDMSTGERVTMGDVFAPDSEGWSVLAQAVREQLTAAFPGVKPDAQALDALCAREALENADFTLGGARMVLTYRADEIYPRRKTLLHVILYYPDIRPLMTQTAQEQTDNSRYRMMALTYDDGCAGNSTVRLLDELRKFGAQATFFLVGKQMEGNAVTLCRQQDSGFSLQMHGFTHDYMLSREQILAEQTHFIETMGGLIGVTPTLMRAPGGTELRYVEAEIGYPLLHWSIASGDSGGARADTVARRVIYKAGDGHVVLMHDLNSECAQATKLILEELSDRGYLFVTVEELFADAGTALEPNHVYYNPTWEMPKEEMK